MHALHRLVVRRLPEGSVAPGGDEMRTVDPPALAGIRLVFGVGMEPEASPTADDFHPVYTISMPVFSIGGLDPDGVYHPTWTPGGREPKVDPPGKKAQARALTRIRRFRYYPVRIRDGRIEVALPPNG